jgi:hypothetical protein
MGQEKHAFSNSNYTPTYSEKHATAYPCPPKFANSVFTTTGFQSSWSIVFSIIDISIREHHIIPRYSETSGSHPHIYIPDVRDRIAHG